MLDLKKAGLVKSARGPKGGYKLSRAASEISFGEIVRSMEGPIALVSCASVNFYAPCGDCHDEATCAIRRAFAILRDQSTQVLDSISLAEGAQWEERLGVGEVARAGLRVNAAARSRRHVDLHHRHRDQPGDALAGSRQAHDRAVDPRAQGRGGRPLPHRAADRDADRLHDADGAAARSALRHAAGRRQPRSGHLRPAVDDPGDDGDDVRAWRGGGSRELARAGRRRHAVRQL